VITYDTWYLYLVQSFENICFGIPIYSHVELTLAEQLTLLELGKIFDEIEIHPP